MGAQSILGLDLVTARLGHLSAALTLCLQGPLSHQDPWSQGLTHPQALSLVLVKLISRTLDSEGGRGLVSLDLGLGLTLSPIFWVVIVSLFCRYYAYFGKELNFYIFLLLYFIHVSSIRFRVTGNMVILMSCSSLNLQILFYTINHPCSLLIGWVKLYSRWLKLPSADVSPGFLVYL